MAFKVNYGLERAERNRVKQARKDAKRKKKAQGGAPDDESDDALPPAPPAPTDTEPT